MSITPHPNVLTVVAAQRRGELLALADRERLARRAADTAGPRQPWLDLPAARAVAGVLALLLAVARPA